MTGSNILTFIPMNTIYGVEEIFLNEADDGTSDAIPISIGFPFGNSIQDEFYVNHIITSLLKCTECICCY